MPVWIRYKPVYFDEWFESFESFISMKQTYFECYVMSTLYSYSLQPILKNQCCSKYEWIRIHG